MASNPGDPRPARPLVELGTDGPIWDRFFTVAPLVLVGTLDADGSLDLAPKHMAMPMGWQNYFGFVCHPSHGTHANIARTAEFTVSYPRPSQVLETSLAAMRRDATGHKPIVAHYDTHPARVVEGAFIDDAYIFLECRHFKTIDGFGENCLITGEIVAARAHPSALRDAERDDQDLIREAPPFVYLAPGRFAAVEDSRAFPFPDTMKR